jgi:hypothetical protein
VGGARGAFFQRFTEVDKGEVSSIFLCQLCSSSLAAHDVWAREETGRNGFHLLTGGTILYMSLHLLRLPSFLQVPVMPRLWKWVFLFNFRNLRPYFWTPISPILCSPPPPPLVEFSIYALHWMVFFK